MDCFIAGKTRQQTIQGAPKMCSSCATKAFKEELEWLQQQDIITPLGIDETVEWYNSFGLVPKPNRKVRLCLEPVRLNQVFIQPVHREPTLSDIFQNKIM